MEKADYMIYILALISLKIQKDNDVTTVTTKNTGRIANLFSKCSLVVIMLAQ